MTQLSLLGEAVEARIIRDSMKGEPQALEQPVRRGPPNRMNDLKYSDWMKFQKSFFRVRTTQALIEECLYFYTKEIWPDGSLSKSLIIGFDDFHDEIIPLPRLVRAHKNISSLTEVHDVLSDLERDQEKFDFVFLNLSKLVTDEDTLSTFLSSHAEKISEQLRNVLVPNRYCAVLVETQGKGGSGFPLPWAVALSLRSHLKLRDEKVGIAEQEGKITYCLFLQADNDARKAAYLDPKTLSITSPQITIPAWTIPKPPPRKKNEILHPAKYPETLVNDFIQLFTKPFDNVFDPMVGTGSTIVAALRSKRNGYGVELVQEFATIAKERAENEQEPLLFESLQPQFMVVQGDALTLKSIKQLSDVKFHYTVTSPPYWSMLSNPGSENQEERRKKNLRLVYSDNERDLGNVQDYDEFISFLETIYTQVATKLIDGGVLTVVVKNVKRNHTLFPLAWDLVAKLTGPNGKYDYLGNTLWCQDDIGLKPFAVGIHWVSNILHTYCLHFKKRTTKTRSRKK